MNNMLLSMFGFVLLSTPLASSAQNPADFAYSTDGSVITITGYNGPNGPVVIPDSIPFPSPFTTNYLPVTSIGVQAFNGMAYVTSVTIPYGVTNIDSSAFSNCAHLQSVTIPNSVLNIADSAFIWCQDLRSLVIPNSVTTIGPFAFRLCESLTSVDIPSSVTSIGIGPFCGCTRLQGITVDALNSNFSSMAGVLCDKSQTTLIQYPCGRTGSYTIFNSIRSIGSYAFQYCPGLTGVTIPSSVTTIGDWVFHYDLNLIKVIVGKNVTDIGGTAFYNCNSLTGVYFMGKAPSLGGNVFLSDSLGIVYYLPGTQGWGATFGGLPTMLWNPQVQTTGATFGLQTNGFGFTVNGTSNLVVAVEACTNLASPSWSAVSSITLTNGSSYFNDPQWKNYPARFYRLTSP